MIGVHSGDSTYVFATTQERLMRYIKPPLPLLPQPPHSMPLKVYISLATASPGRPPGGVLKPYARGSPLCIPARGHQPAQTLTGHTAR